MPGIRLLRAAGFKNESVIRPNHPEQEENMFADAINTFINLFQTPVGRAVSMPPPDWRHTSAPLSR